MPSVELIKAIRAAPRTYLIGNGGSFANAEHIANDLLSCGIRAYSINVPFYSASANDHGYYNSFVKWIEVVGEEGDLLIALSGSGKSPNIAMACEVAERIGMTVWKIFGSDLGQDMQSAEQHQLIIGHELMKGLRK